MVATLATTPVNGKPSATGYHSSDAVIASVQAQLRSDACETRRENARRVRHIYDGEFAYLVTRELECRFAPQTFASLSVDQGVSTLHWLLRDVVDKLAVGWRNGARYALRGPAGPVDSPEFSALVALADYDALMREVETKVRLYSRVLVMPEVYWCERTGTRNFRFTSPRMRSPSSCPGPREDRPEERFALSKEPLKMRGTHRRVASPERNSATAIARLRGMSRSPESSAG